MTKRVVKSAKLLGVVLSPYAQAGQVVELDPTSPGVKHYVASGVLVEVEDTELVEEPDPPEENKDG